MKKYFTLIATIITLAVVKPVNAQWGAQGNPFDRHGSAAVPTFLGLNTWRSWGFGNFTGGNVPLARVHINEFLCLPTNNFANGTLFRTDGANSTINQWQMFTGATNGATTQKFRVFTTLNSNIANGTLMNTENITLEASQRDMIFNAGGNIERMRILGRDQN